MKILVDAMAAEFGGIRTYVEHLLGHWSDHHPEDELHVIIPVGSSLPTVGHVRHELRVRRPRMIGRPWAQTRHLRRLARLVDADAVLVTAPTTTVLRAGPPMVIVILDLRHELRPEQFSRKTKLLRRISYGRSYRLADGFLSISQRSLDDLHELHSELRATPSAVVYLGADHVQSWPDPTRSGPSITFAHHSNKNLDLIIDGWSELHERGAVVPPLLVLGVGSARERVAALIASRGLSTYVTLAPFLPEAEFKQAMTDAEMIIFPSDFEGFGLPVVEGMQLSKAVVIGPERATTEIGGGHAFVMADWSPRALADAVLEARGMTDEARENARMWGLEFSWEQTVRGTRLMLDRLAVGAAASTRRGNSQNPR